MPLRRSVPSQCQISSNGSSRPVTWLCATEAATKQKTEHAVGPPAQRHISAGGERVKIRKIGEIWVGEIWVARGEKGTKMAIGK